MGMWTNADEANKTTPTNGCIGWHPANEGAKEPPTTRCRCYKRVSLRISPQSSGAGNDETGRLLEVVDRQLVGFIEGNAEDRASGRRTLSIRDGPVPEGDRR